MSFSAVFQTAFGLVFIFFLFSLIAGGINETIGRFTNRRARFLERGLWRLIGDDLSRKDPPKDLPGGELAKSLVRPLLGSLAGQAIGRARQEAAVVSAGPHVRSCGGHPLPAGRGEG